MEEITWLDIIKILIPVLTVIFAGFFALYNLRKSIELQAKIKWKEDFRQYTVDYLESFLKYFFFTKDVRSLLKRKEITQAHKEKHAALGIELLGKHNQLTLMIDFEDQDTIRLNELHQEVLDINDLNNMENTIDFSITLGKFYEVAKRIHDKK